MTHSDMKATLLSGLQWEQQQCVALMERARRAPHVDAGRELPAALHTTLETYRALRADTLDWQAAYAKYCEVTAITSAVDLALWLDSFAQARARTVSDFETRLERLVMRGYAAADSDGIYSLTSAGQAALDSGELERISA